MAREKNREGKSNEIKVSYKGSTLIVKVTRDGLLECPICNEYLFYSEEDLFHHVTSHARNLLKKIKPAPKNK